jgi:hypothetical protein
METEKKSQPDPPGQYFLNQRHILTQRRRSAKLFLQSSEIGTPPTPHPQASVPPFPPGSGGRGTLAGGRGVGRVPIPTRGQTLWYSLYIRTLCILRDRRPSTTAFPACWRGDGDKEIEKVYGEDNNILYWAEAD